MVYKVRIGKSSVFIDANSHSCWICKKGRICDGVITEKCGIDTKDFEPKFSNRKIWENK